MTPPLLAALQRSGGAVEVCPTSNLKTLQLGQDCADHPTLGHWLSSAPGLLSICTDDTALFAITLSDELAAVALAFGLSDGALAQLAMGSLEHAFADAALLHAVRQHAATVAARVLLVQEPPTPPARL